MNIVQLIQDVERALTPPRFKHVQGVVQTARQLSERHGVSPEQAETAAWLHDLAREWPRKQLLQAAATIEVPQEFSTIPALLHGPIAAHLGRVKYAIEDQEIIDAVCYHTTGRPKMTPLDMVLFVADAIEPGRNYVGVEEIREAAQEKLSLAARLSIDNTIRFLLDRGKPLFPLTVLTRNELLKEV
jgi:predicted HD superfamily hydrolase involved in NAD metabolism